MCPSIPFLSLTSQQFAPLPIFMSLCSPSHCSCQADRKTRQIRLCKFMGTDHATACETSELQRTLHSSSHPASPAGTSRCTITPSRGAVRQQRLCPSTCGSSQCGDHAHARTTAHARATGAASFTAGAAACAGTGSVSASAISAAGGCKLAAPQVSCKLIKALVLARQVHTWARCSCACLGKLHEQQD